MEFSCCLQSKSATKQRNEQWKTRSLLLLAFLTMGHAHIDVTMEVYNQNNKNISTHRWLALINQSLVLPLSALPA